MSMHKLAQKKDSGVTFDKLLKFDVGLHVQNAVSKANRMIGILRCTFTFLARIHFCSYTKRVGRMLNMSMLYGIPVSIGNQLQ